MNLNDLLTAGAMESLAAALRSGQDINEAEDTVQRLFPTAAWQSVSALGNLWIAQKAEANAINTAGPSFTPARSDIPVNQTIDSPYLYSGYVIYRVPGQDADWQVYVEVGTTRALSTDEVTAQAEAQIAEVIADTLGGRYDNEDSFEVKGFRLTAVVRRSY